MFFRDECDFFKSNSVTDNFLTNVRGRFASITNGMAKTKCSFFLINTQPPMNKYNVLLSSSRYWTTKFHKKSFNNFILFTLKQDIKRRVIINVENQQMFTIPLLDSML